MDHLLAQLGESLTESPVTSRAVLESRLQQLEAEVAQLRTVAATYGDFLYSRTTGPYAWPVLGSREAEGIETPAAYFDLCAKRIRAMRPLRVRSRTNKEPPASLQVCPLPVPVAA